MRNSDKISPKDLLKSVEVRLGFGGGDLYGGKDAAISERLVHASLDAGVRYFDTARLYGNGTGEGVLGNILPAQRDEIILTSKVGIIPWSMRTKEKVKRKAAEAAARLVPQVKKIVDALPPVSELPHAFSFNDMKKSLERSLKALRTDYLDILLLHEPTVEEATRPEVMAFLDQVVAEGKVRSYGFA
ncbi:MAG: aldo/keto reductase, partial [Pseudomonadota bacterium]